MTEHPEDLQRLVEFIGIAWHNTALLVQALTHCSFSNGRQRRRPHEDNGPPPEDYERLEWRGDALLGEVVADFLFRQFPQAHLGQLVRAKMLLTSRPHLAMVARQCNLQQYLRMAEGARERLNIDKPFGDSVLEDAIEAVIGAIYVDQGELGRQESQRFIHRVIIGSVPVEDLANVPLDPKGELTMLIRRQRGISPVYRELEASGPEWSRMVRVGVFVGEELLGTGSGNSWQPASVQAAVDALRKLKG